MRIGQGLRSALALGGIALLLIALDYYAYQASVFSEQLARISAGARR